MAPAKTATRGATVAADKAVVTQSLSHEELMALLGQTGEVAQASSEFHRMKLNGGILETDDGEMFAPKKDGPAVTLRIVKPPVYYNAFYLTEDTTNGGFNAATIGRGDMNGRFSKRYDDPAEQAADTNQANDIYDEVAAATGKRGDFKGDLQVQIVPPDGQMTGDETIYTLTLSTTSVFERRGSTRDQNSGSVSETNFIVKLAQKAAADAAEAGGDVTAQKKAVLDAMTSLRLGGVLADVYPLRAQDEKGTRTWWVLAWVPVHIEPPDGGAPALGAGLTTDPDDVPI